MEILETQVYRGANYWAPVPVIRFLLDIGELEERPTNQIPGFYEKLTTTLPTMYDHRCSVGKPGGFFRLDHLNFGTLLQLFSRRDLDDVASQRLRCRRGRRGLGADQFHFEDQRRARRNPGASRVPIGQGGR